MKTSTIIKGSATSVVALVAGSQAYAQDWTGMYAGVSAANNTGTSPYQPYVDDADGYRVGGRSFGVFAGVRWAATGNVILGLEAAISGPINADIQDDGGSDPEDYMLNGLTDIKISAGIPVGKALIYGFGGVSFGTGTGYSDSTVYTTSGGNLGIGIDYAINDNVSIGAEFIQRTMTGYTSGGNPDPNDPFQSVSLRASFSF